MKTDPDPHGQAALMLLEGLLLLLVQTGVILKQQMAETIDGIVDVKQEVAGTSESVVVSLASIGLLRAVSASLSAAPDPERPPVG